MSLHGVRILRDWFMMGLTGVGVVVFAALASLFWPPRDADRDARLFFGGVSVVAAAIALALLFTLWPQFRGLQRLRWRAEHKCVHCGYSMDGAEGFQCPECGKSNQRL